MDSEFAEESAADGVVDTRPLAERLLDKNWKTRMTSYEELRGACAVEGPERDALFAELSPMLLKMTSDVHPGALDTGLDAALAFVDAAPEASTRAYAERICGNVLDKAFGARPLTQSKGKALLLKLMEVDECGPVCTVLLSRLADKKPKVPPACLDVLRESCALFGARALPIKVLISALPAVLDGTNGPARESAMGLLVDLIRWLGKAVLAGVVDSLRSAQKSDLDRVLAEKEGEGRPTPSLYLRKERPLPGEVKAGGEEAVEGREFVDEVDVGKRLRASEFARMVAEEKWSEHLSGLQIVIDMLGPCPKIKANSDVSDVLAACRGFLRQGHVQVQVSTLKVLALLADGMRQEFGPLVRPMVQSVVLKCKEKRLVPEVADCLRVIVRHCLPFDSMCEDVREQVSSKKVPTHGRAGLLEFATQVLSDSPDRVGTDCLKPLVEACVSACEDPDPKMREACVFCLSALLKAVKARGKAAADAGRALIALENSLPKVYKRVQEGLTAPAPSSASASASAPSGGMKAASASMKDVDDAPATATAKAAPPKTAPVGSALPKKAPLRKAASSSDKPEKAGAASDKAGGEKDEDVEELALSLEDAVAALAALEMEDWAAVQVKMDSAKWQDKVEALEQLAKAITDKNLGGSLSAPLVAFLSAKTTGFKLSNVIILKAVINTACAAARAPGDAKFSRSAAWDLLKNLAPSLSDKKTKEPVEGLLSALSEATSAAFVVRRMRPVMDKIKAPLAHQFYLEWLRQCVTDLGAASFPIPFVASFCQLEMENKDGKVRTAAVEVMGALYHQLGPRMQSMAFGDDTKPALKTLIEAEFARVGYDPAAAAAANKKGGDVDASAALPRQDLLSLLDKTVPSELSLIEGKNSWQNRKTALEAVIAACERSGHFLDANKATQELVRSLKPRLNDTQANLKPLAAAAVGHIVASLESESACKVLRIIAGPLLGGIADNKKGMRDATVAALQMAVTLNRPSEAAEPPLLAALVPSIAEALANPVGRQELLEWMLGQQESLRGDCSDLAAPLVLCLQDKTAAVRSVAEQLLMVLSARSVLPRAATDKATRDLPPAVKRTLTTSIDKVLAACGTGGAKSKDDAAPPAAAPAVAAPAAAALAETLPAPKEETRVAMPPPPPEPSAKADKPALSVDATAATAAPALAVPSSPPRDSWMLKKTSKARRLEDFYKLNWPQPPEDPGDGELLALRTTWEPLMAPELCSLLFPVTKGGALTNQDSFLPAMAELSAQLAGPHAPQHLDLILRWSCVCLGMRESSAGLLKVLQLVSECFALAQRSGAAQEPGSLHDAEVSAILPHLIEKSGHKSERHKLAFKAAIAAAGEAVAPIKLNQLLLAGLACKNKKTRVVCIEEITRVVEANGATSLGRAGVREVGTFLDSKDNDALGRNSCLELCYALYVSMGGDLPKVMKLLGDLSERSVSLIDDRIKSKNKTSGAPIAAAAASTAAPALAPVVAAPAPAAAAAAAPIAPPTPLPTKEEGASPFRLQMTPPDDAPRPAVVAEVAAAATAGVTPTALGASLESEAVATQGGGLAARWAATPGPARTINTEADPAAAPAGAVPSALTPGSAKRLERASTATATADLESVYMEIAAKLDVLLTDSRAELMTESDSAHAECVDYIKILHSIVVGEWAKERLPEDDALLRAHSNALATRLVACLGRSFDSPVLMHADSPGSHLNFDFPLASTSIATLFVMIKRPDIVQQLPSATVVAVLAECLRRLVDDRITSTTDEFAVQIVRALNLIAFKLTAELGAGNALAALLTVVGACRDGPAQGQPAGRLQLPAVCAKPTSRLLQRILTEEVRRPAPFTAPSADPSLLLSSLHDFFAAYASVDCPLSESEELAFSCGKTVLSEMSKAHSVRTLLAMCTAQGIPPSAAMVRLAARMGGVVVEANPELQARVVMLIDEITNARDKSAPIKALSLLLKAHPEMDVNQYLQRLSGAFRTFVLNALGREGSGGGGDEKENSATGAGIGAVGGLKQSESKEKESGGEAMRILDGIRAKAGGLSNADRGNEAEKRSVGLQGHVPAALLSVPSADSDLVSRLAALRALKK